MNKKTGKTGGGILATLACVVAAILLGKNNTPKQNS